MPLDLLTNPDNARFQGAVTIIADPAGNAGGLNMVGGLQFDVISGANNMPPSTTTSQALASGGTITMTSNLQGGHVIYVSCSDTSETTIKLAPTSSSSTSGYFQNGVEITVVNLSVSGTNVVIPPSSAGAFNSVAYTISGGCASRFIYNATLQSWIKLI